MHEKACSSNIAIDEKLLEHAFSNLISNAFKYFVGIENPRFIIDFTKNKMQITISDKDMSIPKEDLKKVFEPFHRSENVHDIQGTGLGMSIAKEYLSINDATIKVKSKLKVGTDFILQFSS